MIITREIASRSRNPIELGAVVEFLDHKRKPIRSSEREEGDVPYYGANGIQGHVRGHLFDEPLILLAEDGGHFDDPIRGIAYEIKGKSWVNNHAHVLRAKPDTDHRYLLWALKHYDVVPYITGSTRAKLTKGQAEKLLLPFPEDIDEQRRIAAILDKADAIRRKRQQALALADEFLKSVFLEMFGDPTQIRDSKSCIDDIAAVARGRFSPRPRNDPRFFGGEFPFIQTAEIANSDGYLTEHNQTLNSAGTLVSKSFPIGTVFVAIVGATIGATAVSTKEYWCPDSVIGINSHDANYPAEFIEFLLRFWKPVFVAKAPSTARANINLQTIKPVPVPSATEDKPRKFADIYKQVQLTKRNFRNQETQLFASLSQRAFRGQL